MRTEGVELIRPEGLQLTQPTREPIEGLTAEEAYLADAYVSVAQARDLYAVNYLESESLFTMLDSTIDTTRIANTIRELNKDPDRWLLVFESIQRDLTAPQGNELENSR